MEKNWLIRTFSGRILGPISKEKLIDLVEKKSISDDDELCSGNGFWFYVREESYLTEYLYGQTRQPFNPVSEAKNVLTRDAEDDLDDNENENEVSDQTLVLNVGELNLESKEEIPTEEESIIPVQQDLEYPDMDCVDSADGPAAIEVNVVAEEPAVEEKSAIEEGSLKEVKNDPPRNDRYLIYVLIILATIIGLIIFIYLKLVSTSFSSITHIPSLINGAYAEDVSSSTSNLIKKKVLT